MHFLESTWRGSSMACVGQAFRQREQLPQRAGQSAFRRSLGRRALRRHRLVARRDEVVGRQQRRVRSADFVPVHSVAQPDDGRRVGNQTLRLGQGFEPVDI